MEKVFEAAGLPLVSGDVPTADKGNGPRALTLEQDTHHKADSAGNECIACHMPKIAQTLGDVNVRSHTFKFVSPDSENIPNSCNVCHTDKPTAWAADALKKWPDRSPWRMAD